MADDDIDASAFTRQYLRFAGSSVVGLCSVTLLFACLFVWKQGTFSTKAPDQGFNPALVVLLVVVGTVLVFIVGNYALFSYARKTMPPRRKKPVSKKKLKRERLKAGVAPAGD